MTGEQRPSEIKCVSPIKLGFWFSCAVTALAAALTLGHPGPKKPTEPPAIEAVPPGPIMSGSRLTVSLTPSTELETGIRAVAEGSKTVTLRLTFVGVTPPPSRASVRVYLNADSQKPLPGTDSPQYVAAFSFYGATGTTGAEDMMLSLNAAVVRLRQAGLLNFAKPLTITAIAVPLKPQDDVSDVKILFKRLRLSAVRGP